MNSKELSYPPVGSKWRSKTEGTRKVIDRDFGGRVVYRQLYANKSSSEHRCSLSEWHQYQAKAKLIPQE